MRHPIKKGDKVQLVKQKPKRAREKRVPKSFFKYKRAGIVVRRKPSFNYDDHKAYEVQFNYNCVAKNFTKIVYFDEMIHESEMPSLNFFVSVNGNSYVWRDASGKKRCPECGNPIGENESKKYCKPYCRYLNNWRRFDAKRRRDEKRIEYKKKNAKEWRKRMKERGLCTRCGKSPTFDGLLVCDQCREEINMTRKKF